MPQSIDIVRILSLLPHRYPFILVDKVLDYELHKHLTALKNVTVNEPVFMGHFPGQPIMPGVLILEALAQACVILSSLSLKPPSGHKLLYLFAGIDDARFKHIVTPGDQLRLQVKTTAKKRDVWRMHCEAWVGEKLACSAELLSAIKVVPCD